MHSLPVPLLNDFLLSHPLVPWPSSIPDSGCLLSVFRKGGIPSPGSCPGFCGISAQQWHGHKLSRLWQVGAVLLFPVHRLSNPNIPVLKTKRLVGISREGSSGLGWIKRIYAKRKQDIDVEYLNLRSRKVTHSSNLSRYQFTDVFVILPATAISDIEMASGAGR